MSSPLYTDEGLRVLLAEDWFIYVVNENNNRIYAYNTEVWPEWAKIPGSYIGDAPTSVMVPFAHKYRPHPIAALNCDYCIARGDHDHMTLEQWERHIGGAA